MEEEDLLYFTTLFTLCSASAAAAAVPRSLSQTKNRLTRRCRFLYLR